MIQYTVICPNMWWCFINSFRVLFRTYNCMFIASFIFLKVYGLHLPKLKSWRAIKSLSIIPILTLPYHLPIPFISPLSPRWSHLSPLDSRLPFRWGNPFFVANSITCFLVYIASETQWYFEIMVKSYYAILPPILNRWGKQMEMTYPHFEGDFIAMIFLVKSISSRLPHSSPIAPHSSPGFPRWLLWPRAAPTESWRPLLWHSPPPPEPIPPDLVMGGILR